MTPAGQWRIFRALSGEAIRDALRRRIVPVIAAISLLSLFVVDGCTSCATPSIVQDGVAIEVPEVAGWAGAVIYSVLALWVIVLAGILASDHLVEPLSDGSASLVLARPVGRSTFALTRLVGLLTITTMTGLVVVRASLAGAFALAGLGVEWIFAALIADYIVKASLLAWRFRSGRWQQIEI